MPRGSRDDDDVAKRPARSKDPRRSRSEAVGGAPDRGLSRSRSGDSLRRGIGRTKSGNSSRVNVNTITTTTTTATNVDKSKSSRRSGGGGKDGGIPTDISMQSDLTSSYPTAGDVLEKIPSEYLKNPETAEPVLHYLPKMVASTGMVTSSGVAGATTTNASPSASNNKNRFPNLRILLAAAEDDIRLHRARQQAGKHRDSKLLKTYKIETDAAWLTRQQRLNERALLLGKLDTERAMILKELLEGNTAGLTAKEATAIQLARWQRALELYVYNPPAVKTKKADASVPSAAASSAGGEDGGGGGGGGAASVELTSPAAAAAQNQAPSNLDFLGLLEKLMETSAEVRRSCCFANANYDGLSSQSRVSFLFK